MQEISRIEWVTMKNTSLDYYARENVWWFHMPNNKFYVVRHAAGKFYISKESKHMTDVIFSIMADKEPVGHLASSRGW